MFVICYIQIPQGEKSYDVFENIDEFNEKYTDCIPVYIYLTKTMNVIQNKRQNLNIFAHIADYMVSTKMITNNSSKCITATMHNSLISFPVIVNIHVEYLLREKTNIIK